MKLSLIIPCFNEENNVLAFFDEANKILNSIECQYVFVNDGSSDDTEKNLRKIFAENADTDIRIVSFSRNFGKEAAIYAGLQNSDGELTCIIDADLQQRPEVVLEMLSVLEKNSDVDCVCAYQGQRRENKLVGLLKEGFYSVINRISDTEFVRDASDFRLFRSNVKQAILSMSEYHRFSKGIFAWVGFKTEYIPYEVMERHDGKSKWSLKKLFGYAFGGIMSFTDFPLKLPIGVGGVGVIAALVYALVEIIMISGGSRETSASVLAVILLLLIGGIELICLGFVGLYLGKVFAQVQNRPVYIVKDILKREKSEK